MFDHGPAVPDGSRDYVTGSVEVVDPHGVRSVTHQNTSTSKVRATNDPVDGLNGVALESVVYVNVGGNVAFL